MCSRKSSRILVHQPAAHAVSNYVRMRSHRGDHDHRGRAHGLDGRQPEALVTGSGHEQMRPLQQPA